MSESHEENTITFTVVDSLEKTTHCCDISTGDHSNGYLSKIMIEGIPFDVHNQLNELVYPESPSFQWIDRSQPKETETPPESTRNPYESMLELIPGKHYEPIGEYDNEQEKIDNLTYLCHYMGGFEHTVNDLLTEMIERKQKQFQQVKVEDKTEEDLSHDVENVNGIAQSQHGSEYSSIQTNTSQSNELPLQRAESSTKETSSSVVCSENDD